MPERFLVHGCHCATVWLEESGPRRTSHRSARASAPVAGMDHFYRRAPQRVYWGEPICRVLPSAPLTYHAHAAWRVDPLIRYSARSSDRVLAAWMTRILNIITGRAAGDRP